MESLKKHGDPLEEEIRQDPARGVEEVASNQPGGPNAQTGQGGAEPGSQGWREDEQEIVRSADQTPNPSQPDDDATTPAETDLSKRRSNM